MIAHVPAEKVTLSTDCGMKPLARMVAKMTLKALADHGELGTILPADGGDCEEVLAQFAKVGIDVDALAAQLQDEGAKSFVKSWNELMAVITSKSAVLKEAVAG